MRKTCFELTAFGDITKILQQNIYIVYKRSHEHSK